MNQRSRDIIRIEANFIQELIWRIYTGQEEFTELNKITLFKRLQAIRDEAKK